MLRRIIMWPMGHVSRLTPFAERRFVCVQIPELNDGYYCLAIQFLTSSSRSIGSDCSRFLGRGTESRLTRFCGQRAEQSTADSQRGGTVVGGGGRQGERATARGHEANRRGGNISVDWRR